MAEDVPALSRPPARLLELLRDAVLYGAAGMSGRLFALLTFPVLARVLSSSDYGVMDALSAVGGLLAILLTLGQDSALARFLHEDTPPAERDALLSRTLLAQGAACLLVIPPLWVLAGQVAGATVATPGQAGALRLVLLGLPATVFLNSCRNLLKWTFARRGYVLLEVLPAALVAGLTLLFTLVVRRGIEGVFLAQALGMLLAAPACLLLCRGKFARPRGLALSGDLLRFGWPFMAVGLLLAAIPALDRTLAIRILGTESAGHYGAAFRIAALLQLPILAFESAAGPFFFAHHRDPRAPALFRQTLEAYAAVLAVLVFGAASLGAPLVALLASPRYLPGAPAVLPLAVALAVRSLGWVTSLGIPLSLRTQLQLPAYAAGVLGTVGGIAAAAPRLGVGGVALGVALGALAQGLTATWLAYRVHPLRFNLVQPAAWLAAGALAALPFTRAPQPQGPGFYALWALVLAALGGAAARKGRSALRGQEPLSG